MMIDKKSGRLNEKPWLSGVMINECRVLLPPLVHPSSYGHPPTGYSPRANEHECITLLLTKTAQPVSFRPQDPYKATRLRFSPLTLSVAIPSKAYFGWALVAEVRFE